MASYDNSKTLAGDVADITASDDGTADHVIWHAQPNGGVLLRAVGGGGDTTPQLWRDLRTGGWSYANSQPMLGDVNGDGWDDLVVIHRNGSGANVWVFLSDGQRLGPPQLWSTQATWGARYLMADLGGDLQADLAQSVTLGSTPEYSMVYSNGSSAFSGYVKLFEGSASAGWSLVKSRLLSGDGLQDLVTMSVAQFAPPVVWQDLRTGGWSFAGCGSTSPTPTVMTSSTWSVFTSGNPGILVWRHRSTGSSLGTPQVVADLRTGGWSYSASREGVADTYGVVTP